jgi:hypothetical protein
MGWAEAKITSEGKTLGSYFREFNNSAAESAAEVEGGTGMSEKHSIRFTEAADDQRRNL